MFEGLFQPMHLVVILFIALLVFGPKKLPELGKGLGDGIRSFKDSMRNRDEGSPKTNGVDISPSGTNETSREASGSSSIC
jgi:sec-independent protein translocase protein TatA